MKNTLLTFILFVSVTAYAGGNGHSPHGNPLHPSYNQEQRTYVENTNIARATGGAAQATGGSATATGQGGRGGDGGHGGTGGAVTIEKGAVTGGTGGTGGNANQWQRVDNSGNSTNSNANDNYNDNANTNSGNNTGSSSVSINQNYEAKRIPVSTAYAPALTSGIDTCLGSFSTAAQHTVFGISFGKTTIDDNCVMLKQARMLHEMGLRVAAWQRLCQTKETRQALLDSGEYDCRSTAAQLAQLEINKDLEKLAAQQKLKDAEILKEAQRIVIEKQVRDEIAAKVSSQTVPLNSQSALSSGQTVTREFGTPTYVAPQACKPTKRKVKRSPMPPCK